MKIKNDASAQHGSAWYQQPILWLGALVFIASMAGCIWLIVVGARYADTPLDTPHTVFGVPVSAHSSRNLAPIPVRPRTDPPQ